VSYYHGDAETECGDRMMTLLGFEAECYLERGHGEESPVASAHESADFTWRDGDARATTKEHAKVTL
jgi:hypothetical protein